MHGGIEAPYSAISHQYHTCPLAAPAKLARHHVAGIASFCLNDEWPVAFAALGACLKNKHIYCRVSVSSPSSLAISIF